MSKERERWESIERAKRCGLTEDDAIKLRRIALTLHRWFELECGDSNDYYSFCLVRGQKNGDTFEHDDNGQPYIERHENRSTRTDGKYRAYWTRIPDRETGARKRLDKIMANYPALRAWIQTDPRGGTIYLCKPEDATDGLYTRGVFIC